MKKILLTFAATTALWAALVSGAVYTNHLWLLTKSDVQALEEAYENLYIRGYEMFLAYQKCKNST